jgi:4,5:9,10-diseco-3-hydroxy-5,9,17-trioxoandrosta-1(10),2-diene-4-oate hydrolase
MSELLDFDTTSKMLDDAWSLHYHEYGSGPALILLHGSGPGVSGWSNFAGNLPVFGLEYRTIVLDMPGFGRSPQGKLDRRYPHIAADAIATLMDRLGIDKAHLLGNSMGGMVAMQFALNHPGRADRLVLMGPAGVNVVGPPVSEGARRLNEFLAAPSREGMVAWVDTMVAERSVVSDDLIDERFRNALVPGAIESAKEIFASLYDPSFRDGPPLWSLTHQIRHRTLVTWGRDDRMVPFEHGLLPWRRMPNAELHVFPRCGHWAQVERKADFERVVLEFLSRP